MEIDKIKWMVGYAEGFEMEENEIVHHWFSGTRLHLSKVTATIWALYPLLLQRAIEGINRRSVIDQASRYYFIIFQDLDQFKVRDCTGGLMIDYGFPYDIKDPEAIDEAKEQALDYVYEQEKINEDKK